MSLDRTVRKRIDTLQQVVDDLVLDEVRRLARIVMCKDPQKKEFIMAMGSWHFDGDENKFKTCVEERRLADLLDVYDRVTGNPMRFTATGPERNSWGVEK